MSLADVTSAIDALEAALHSVVGESATRFYAPMSLGAFADVVDALRELGINIERMSPSRVHAITSTNDVYNIVADDDHTVAQLLQGNGSWWPTIEKTLQAHIHGDVGAAAAPTDDATSEDKVDWLRKQADRVVDAAKAYRDKRVELTKEEMKAVRDKGAQAIEKTRRAAVDLKRGADKKIKDAANGVINTVKGAASIAEWGAGISVGVVVVVGLLIYASAKSGQTQKRIASQRDYFVGEARRAGVRI